MKLPEVKLESDRPHVIVCGGRSYDKRAHVYAVLDEINPIFVVQGGALGADTLARQWAETRGIPCATFHAWWTRFGKSAGGRRNAWMLMFVPVDLVVAFPGGRGTADMVSKATLAGVTVRDERSTK
jgi:hypothetical protein